MPARSIGSTSAEIISMAKAARDIPRVAKPKPAPVVLPEGPRFAKLPAAAVFDPNLSDGEVRALAAIAFMADYKTKLCSVKQTTVARRLSVFRQSVNRWIAALVAKGYLRLVRKTKRGNGGDGPNVYRVIYPELIQDALQRSHDASGDDSRYPTSGNDEFLASDVPSAIASGETVRLTK